MSADKILKFCLVFWSVLLPLLRGHGLSSRLLLSSIKDIPAASCINVNIYTGKTVEIFESVINISVE
jgi:hypothetical protein